MDLVSAGALFFFPPPSALAMSETVNPNDVSKGTLHCRCNFVIQLFQNQQPPFFHTSSNIQTTRRFQMSSSIRCRIMLLSLIALLALQACVVAHEAPSAHSSDDDQLNALQRLYLVGNATGLSYVATHGSYFEPTRVNDTIGPELQWWPNGTQRLSIKWRKLDDMELNPVGCGLRALAFASIGNSHVVNGWTGPVVIVAFRGTDTNVTQASGQCDMCADALLWSPKRLPGALPPWCGHYPASDLDYLSVARNYVASIARAYPAAGILLTGHSLGAGIAAILGASSPVAVPECVASSVQEAIVFSTPGFLEAVAKYTSAPVHQLNADKVTIIADVYDPVFFWARQHPFGGAVGLPCFWNCSGPPSPFCALCEFSEPWLNMSSFECLVCFAERHTYSHYVALIRNTVGWDRSSSMTGGHPLGHDSAEDSACVLQCQPRLRGCVDELYCPSTGRCG